MAQRNEPTVSLLEEHRRALTGHCYRMLGSISEADDAVQETIVRGWRAFDQFEGKSALRTWLYRIATNVCLDRLKSDARRTRPIELGPSGTVRSELVTLPHERWIEPVPDALVGDDDPQRRALLRESVRLAFVAALQHLPPRQRAALLLTEVLELSAIEAAEILETTVASINSALQRARATMASVEAPDLSTPLPPPEASLLDRYVAAFERYDVPALTELLREDATMCMPPYALWLRGPEAIAAWFLGPGIGCRGSLLRRTEANGAPAFAQYRASPEGHRAWALIVLDASGARISGVTSFLDTATVFPRFGLPLSL